MNLKQWSILFAGTLAIILLIIFPRWLYPPSTLIFKKGKPVYGSIFNPPGASSVVKEENGRQIYFFDSSIKPSIDYQDLILRSGLIMLLVIFGLWFLQKRKPDRIHGVRDVRE